MSVWEQIRRDYGRYQATGNPKWFVILLMQGLWASSLYRISRHLQRRVRFRPVRKILGFVLFLLHKGMEVTTGISLPWDCEIGDGLFIGHFGNIIVNDQVKIGRNCNLSQGITLGVAGRGENRGCPTLGNRVHVGAHAIVIGKITIGDDAVIGAGAIVTKSVPPRAVVVGNPGRIISFDGSFDFVRYHGMAEDPQRLASLQADGSSDPGRGDEAASPDSGLVMVSAH